MACWTIAGERQAARIRSKYLRAILRQDVTFFDTETSTGEVITRMSGDTVVIQEALGEKVEVPITPMIRLLEIMHFIAFPIH